MLNNIHKYIIGTPLNVAEIIADKFSVIIRATVIDGAQCIIIRNYVKNRLNVQIRNNVITRVIGRG